MVSFNDPEKFAELERQAYDGQLDFNSFPAAEYRYFDRIQDIGYRVRHEGFPKDFARRDIAQAKRDYLDDIDERASNVNAARQYTESRISRRSGLHGRARERDIQGANAARQASLRAGLRGDYGA